MAFNFLHHMCKKAVKDQDVLLHAQEHINLLVGPNFKPLQNMQLNRFYCCSSPLPLKQKNGHFLVWNPVKKNHSFEQTWGLENQLSTYEFIRAPTHVPGAFTVEGGLANSNDLNILKTPAKN